jgi:hypothetical protein
MPQGSTPASLTVDGTDTNILMGKEGSYPVAWQLVDIDPQATATVQLSYQWPGAVHDDGSFELALWPQAAARSDSYTVTVRAPDGYELAGAGQTKPEVTVSGRLKEPVSIDLTLMPAN